jgi:outer membrane protein, heavy metal efflux system
MQQRRRRRNWLAASVAIVLGTLAPTAAGNEVLTLERAIQLARARALVVAHAEGDLRAANAHMTGARVSAIGNPYADIQIDRGFAAGQEVQALAFTYFPVDIGGHRGARIDEADKLIQWRKLGLLDARAIATGETVSSYGELVTGAARLSLAIEGEIFAREEAKYFAGRLEARDTTIYEKALADAEVARWVQLRAESELRLITARARFAQLTGVAEGNPTTGDAASLPPGLRAPWDDGYLARALDRSPLIARQRAEQTFWDASKERFKTEAIPPVAFELIGGRGSVGETRLGGGVVLTFPITRRFQGEVARAEQGHAQATRVLAVHQHVMQARLRAARDSLALVRSALEELDKHGLPAMDLAVSSSQESYKLGKIELTRVLLARRDLAAGRLRRLELLEAAWRAFADLAILSGDLP